MDIQIKGQEIRIPHIESSEKPIHVGAAETNISFRLFPEDPIPTNVTEADVRNWTREDYDQFLEDVEIDLGDRLLTHVNIFRSLNHSRLSHYINLTFAPVKNIGEAKVFEKDGNSVITDKKITRDELLAWLPSNIVMGYGVYGFYQNQLPDGKWQTRWTTGSTCD